MKREVAEFPGSFILRLVFVPNAAGFDENTRAGFQIIEKYFGFPIGYLTNVRIFLAKLVQQVEKIVFGKALHAALAHCVGDILELGNGFIFFYDVMVPGIPIEEHGDCFSIELGAFVGEFPHLAFHQGHRRQQHRITR